MSLHKPVFSRSPSIIDIFENVEPRCIGLPHVTDTVIALSMKGKMQVCEPVYTFHGHISIGKKAFGFC